MYYLEHLHQSMYNNIRVMFVHPTSVYLKLCNLDCSYSNYINIDNYYSHANLFFNISLFIYTKRER